MINTNLTFTRPTLKMKKIAFKELKNDLFPKPQKHTLKTNDIPESNNPTSNTRLILDKNSHISNENIIKLIEYVFSDNKKSIEKVIEYKFSGNNTFIYCENNKGLKSHIDILKRHRSKDQSHYTKSLIDVAITLYIAYIINDKEINSENKGYNGLKSVFDDEFENHFVNFLKTTCKISKEVVTKIKPSYIKYIKLLTGTTYIKLNNYILDINSVAVDNTQCHTSGQLNKVKNSTIRNNLSHDEVQDLKKEAQDYFNKIITSINSKTTNNTPDKQKQQDLILKIIHFNKMLNVFSRKFSEGEFNYANYIEIAEKTEIFKGLAIESPHDKLEFINHSIMLNYKRHKGINLKRILFKAPLLTLSLATTISGMIIGAMTSLPGIIALGGFLTIAMLTFFIVGGFESLTFSTYAFTRLAQMINCGDSYNKYTNSATEVFIKLTQAYNNEEKINGKPINKNNYKETECWSRTIMNSAVKDNTNRECHIAAMNNMRQSTRKKNRHKFPIYADEYQANELERSL